MMPEVSVVRSDCADCDLKRSRVGWTLMVDGERDSVGRGYHDVERSARMPRTPIQQDCLGAAFSNIPICELGACSPCLLLSPCYGRTCCNLHYSQPERDDRTVSSRR
jgi:hypothetical protein